MWLLDFSKAALDNRFPWALILGFIASETPLKPKFDAAGADEIGKA